MEPELFRKIGLGNLDSRGCLDTDTFSESRKDFGTYRLGEFQNGGKQVDISLGTDVDGQSTETHELSEPVQTRTSRRYNLRKSLAWDAAFFTSAGVLEPEELSSLIIGADKGVKDVLPGIQEDLRCSSESISDLGSESFCLETFEDDLFVDIRASIVRSSKNMPNSTIQHNKKTYIGVDGVPIKSLEKEGVASQNKNARPVSKKTNDLQKKSLPKLNIVKLGSGKAVNHDAGRSQSQVTAIAKIGDKSPIITSKPKTAGRSISTTTALERGSIGTGPNKSENGISKQASTSTKGTDGPTKLLARSALSSKASLSGLSTTSKLVHSMTSHPSNGSHGVSSGNNTKSQPRSVLSSTASLSGLSTTTRQVHSMTTHPSNGSRGVSSGNNTESQAMMPRRIPGRSSIDGASSSGSTPKTTGSMPKKKPASSTLSAHLRSNKISSSVSPASSVSEWSSVSTSSSSSMTNNRVKFSKEKTSLDSRSFRSVDSYVNLGCQKRNSPAEQTANKSKNQEINILISNSNNSSIDGIALASMKPSRLRMPSPKLGFFDGVKSSPCTPGSNRLSRLGSQSVLPKNRTSPGTSPICSSNGISKSAKVSTSRASMSFTKTKQDSPKPTSTKSSREKLYSSESNISSLTSFERSPSSHLNVKGKASGQGFQTPEKVLREGGVTHKKTGSGDINLTGKNVSSVKVVDQILDKLANQYLANDEKENAVDKYQSIYELECKLLSSDTSAKRSPFAVKKLATQAGTDKKPFALPS